MISGSQEIQPFALSNGLVALSGRHVTPGVNTPYVQVMNLAGGMNVSGKEAVEELLRACLFALRREHEIE